MWKVSNVSTLLDVYCNVLWDFWRPNEQTACAVSPGGKEAGPNSRETWTVARVGSDGHRCEIVKVPRSPGTGGCVIARENDIDPLYVRDEI